jgi:UDP-N-acetylmuramoyl-L-alanyl-D-glutamate--2,6-diaminopimelate ligase
MNRELKNIASLFDNPEVKGNLDKEISSISLNSNEIEKGAMFCAIVGDATDGHKYIESAIENGAETIVCQEFPEKINENITYVKVKDSYIALALACKQYYDNPSSKLKLVAVTGTNGKTSIATLLYEMLLSMGFGSGLLSTIENRVNNTIFPTKLTTPDVLTINKLLAEMVEQGCDYCFMEASSHAIVQNRIYGLEFDVAGFTNITHEHLDYHKEFSEYIKAKKLLFDNLPKTAVAITNIDDRNGEVMLQNSKATKKTYSLKSMSDYKARIIEPHFDGTLISIDGNELWVNFIGEFNIYNLLTIYAIAIELGLEKQEVLVELSKLKPVSGRFEFVKSSDNKIGIVDYAHSPDALENVLETIVSLRQGDSEIITVVGCGGDRDKTKRPEMAKIAKKYSDKVVLTSDNPRTEDPDQIIKDMEEGIKNDRSNVLSITNRAEGIKTACMLAKAGDIILVAGKGHENYQEVHGVRNHFDDKEELINNFN